MIDFQNTLLYVSFLLVHNLFESAFPIGRKYLPYFLLEMKYVYMEPRFTLDLIACLAEDLLFKLR